MESVLRCFRLPVFSFRTLAAVLLATSSACQNAPAADISLSKSAAARIDAAAQRIIADGAAPGAAVVVVRDGRLIHAQGYGLANIETNDPVRAETVFRAGSITKMFTAAAIMQLVQEGRISLDDPVARYVPELGGAPTITIRMLLVQTAGLHEYADTLEDVCKSRTTQQVIDHIAVQDPLTDFTPGTNWAYSNSNYFLLGAIIERVSGHSYGDYISANVTGPLELETIAFDQYADIVPHRASGYIPIQGAMGEFLNAECLSADNAGGAGSLRSSAPDLARWQQAFLSGEIIDQTRQQEMTNPGQMADGAIAVRSDPTLGYGPQYYAFGLEIGELDGQKTIGHAGSVPGFTAYLVTFPALRLTVAIMTNGMPRNAEIFHEIERAALHDSLQ